MRATVSTRSALIVFVGLLVLALSETVQAAAGINWQVENRFRFYRNAEVFTQYAKAALAPNGERPSDLVQWIRHTERRLQDGDAGVPPADVTGWAAHNLGALCWNRETKTFSYCRKYLAPKSHRVIVEITGVTVGLATRCTWFVADGPRDGSLPTIAVARQFAKGRCVGVKLDVRYDSKRETPGTYVFARIENPGATEIAGPEPVQVKDILIVGMGDSFGAGVGNPDQPAKLDPAKALTYDLHGRTVYDLPSRPGVDASGAKRGNTFSNAQAQWLDRRCFRSQYGHQFRAALHLAVLLTKSAVTYLDFACDGARIIEGLLHSKPLSSGFGTNTPRPASQIAEVNKLLCASHATETVRYELVFRNDSRCAMPNARVICEYGDPKFQSAQELRPTAAGRPKTTMSVCPTNGSDLNGWLRPIDLVFLSIGGNDIGFAPMVGNVLIGNEAVAWLLHRLGDVHSGAVGRTRLGLLLNKYRKLDYALFRYLPIRGADHSRILLTAYPIPVAQGSGAGLKVCGGLDAAKAVNAADFYDSFWAYADPNTPDVPAHERQEAKDNLPDVLQTSCLLNINRAYWAAAPDEEARDKQVADINKGICSLVHERYDTEVDQEHNNALGWTYITGFLDAFDRHSFCASGARNVTDRNLEIPYRDGDTWTPYAVQNFRPYAETQRWLRTPNDAFLITNWHGGGRVTTRENLALATSTSAMHPTAEGQAVIADHVLSAALKKLCEDGSLSREPDDLCH